MICGYKKCDKEFELNKYAPHQKYCCDSHRIYQWNLNNPEKYKIIANKYNQSEKGKAKFKRYDQSEKGKINHIKRQTKYDQSEKGKATRDFFNRPETKLARMVKQGKPISIRRGV